ncbi:dTMP kinase [Levilactobacillus bambusae]|uniref:Thymidylate kinase n=1 Tax=Levilactobacillus bambusae TaxID=2024736 RepID=A0A2V1MX20_9LACO|nr:dTMP kinase [Levilactobacillus bambusae]PWF99392.1 dTMP kinase [Levilactobacillus bambusae]
MPGKFITFEGPDGAGKTSVMKAVSQQLQVELGDQLVVTREPGGNPISEAIRQIILDKNNTAMDVRTEALLYAAARRQHLSETILPALAANKLVLCDRYIDSSVVYQGAGREIGERAVYDMNQFATEGLMPDLTLYFEVPVEVGLARIAKNRPSQAQDRLDLEQAAFHERVHDAYLKLVAGDPKRIKVIDATAPLEQVEQETLTIIKNSASSYFK